MTRSKHRELESLRAQHEEMVATMQETAARREAVSNQLISHYKGESHYREACNCAARRTN